MSWIMRAPCQSPSGYSLNLCAVKSTNKNCLICANATKCYQKCRVCPSDYYPSGEDCVGILVKILLKPIKK